MTIDNCYCSIKSNFECVLALGHCWYCRYSIDSRIQNTNQFYTHTSSSNCNPFKILNSNTNKTTECHRLNNTQTLKTFTTIYIDIQKEKIIIIVNFSTSFRYRKFETLDQYNNNKFMLMVHHEPFNNSLCIVYGVWCIMYDPLQRTHCKYINIPQRYDEDTTEELN